MNTRRVLWICLIFAVVTGGGCVLAFGAQGSGSPDEFESIEQVEAAFDPDDDPSIVVGLAEDGGAIVRHLSVDPAALPDGYPTLREAGVRTISDLESYVAKLNESAEANAKRAGE